MRTGTAFGVRIGAMLILTLVVASLAQPQGYFIRGDVTCDGHVDMDDVNCLVGPWPCDPPCERSADFDGDGHVTALDLAALLDCVVTGACPPPPWPRCGADHTNPLPCDRDCCTPDPGRVIVESRAIPPGQTAATIAIRLRNDLHLSQVVVPLEIREGTAGSYVTDLALSYNDRIAGVLTDVSVTDQYAERDGICGSGNSGYGTITFSDGASHPVASSPEGVMFARARVFSPPLSPGEDATGSLIMTVNVTNTIGWFEIDTACTTPNNHLQFVEDYTSNVFVPAFSKGVISICDCAYQCDYYEDGFLTALDLGQLIDVLFGGDPDIQDPGCPTSRGDFDYDGVPTALDLGGLIDHLFAGHPGPCDPCNPVQSTCTP